MYPVPNCLAVQTIAYQPNIGLDSIHESGLCFDELQSDLQFRAPRGITLCFSWISFSLYADLARNP